MEVVVEMEEMETVAHDLTRLVVEGRPGTQARSRAGLDAFFRVRVLLRVARFWVLATATRVAIFRNRILCTRKSPSCHPTVSPRATFISFRNVVAAPRYPSDATLLGIGGLSTGSR